jgi:hypothetical protein
MNEIYLDMYWKEDTSCLGSFQVRNCTLRAATVEYPVEVKLNVSQAVPGPYYSLQSGTTRFDDKVIRQLPVYPDEGDYNKTANTTYGGIYMSLATWFGSTLSINNYTRAGRGSNVISQGQLAAALTPDYQDYLSDDSPYSCNLSVGWALANIGYFQAFNQHGTFDNATLGWWNYFAETTDPTTLILDQVRQSMFLASVYSGAQWYTSIYTPAEDVDEEGNWYLSGDMVEEQYVQHVNATRLHTTPTYEVRWYLWGASVALTYLIILIILPTFWGFWILRRKPTMSPVDLARAFNAPAVTVSTEENLNQMPVKVLLKEVGAIPLHKPLTSRGPSVRSDPTFPGH